MDVVVENKEWKSGKYEVKRAGMSVNLPDVYHVYKSGKYAAQRRSLEGCEEFIQDDIKDDQEK